MLRRALLFVLPLSLFTLLAMAAGAQTATGKLTAAQIVDKTIAAQGGLQAWRGVQSMSWTGKMDAGGGDSAARSKRFAQSKMAPTSNMQHGPVMAPDKAEGAQQVQLPFVLKMKRGRKSRLEIEFAGKTAVQVYDGANGWKLRPFLNRNDVEPFTADEAKAQAQQADLDGPLVDYAAKGTKVDLDGVEKVEGRDAYKLKLTLKGGQVQHVWIDAQNFMEVKIEGTPRRMDGKFRPVAIYLREYQPVQGLMVPHVLETAVEGYRETHKMVIESVVVNPKLEDSLFSKPQAK